MILPYSPILWQYLTFSTMPSKRKAKSPSTAVLIVHALPQLHLWVPSPCTIYPGWTQRLNWFLLNPTPPLIFVLELFPSPQLSALSRNKHWLDWRRPTFLPYCLWCSISTVLHNSSLVRPYWSPPCECQSPVTPHLPALYLPSLVMTVQIACTITYMCQLW